MMAGMDDKHDIDDCIALESMSGLERFLLNQFTWMIFAIIRVS